MNGSGGPNRQRRPNPAESPGRRSVRTVDAKYKTGNPMTNEIERSRYLYKSIVLSENSA